jgi:hypothetical protein
MLKLAYCDYIADRIKRVLKREIEDNDTLISQVGPIQSDLDPVGGWFVSPKKTIVVHDINGKAYSVTIEEQPVLDIFFEDVDKKVVDNEFN